MVRFRAQGRFVDSVPECSQLLQYQERMVHIRGIGSSLTEP